MQNFIDKVRSLELKPNLALMYEQKNTSRKKTHGGSVEIHGTATRAKARLRSNGPLSGGQAPTRSSAKPTKSEPTPVHSSTGT